MVNESLKPCCLSPAHSWAIQSQSIFSSHWIPSRGKLEDWSSREQLENLWNRNIENLYLKPALIVSVPLGSHPVGDGVDHVNLQKICRGRVGIVKSLLFAAQSLCGIITCHDGHPESLLLISGIWNMLIQYYIQRLLVDDTSHESWKSWNSQTK